MTVQDQINHFSDHYSKQVIVNNRPWRYYRLGAGAPILWLTGGLRRVALGFPFMERLATRHTVVAPDYPPVQTIGEFTAAFETILHAEGINTFVLGGQSYGGLQTKDIPQYTGLFGRAICVIDMGDMGHTAAPLEPDRYVELLEQGLTLGS